MARKVSRAKVPATSGPWQSAAFPRRQIQVQQGASDPETAQNFVSALTGSAAAAVRVTLAVERRTGLLDSLDVPALVAHLRAEADAVSAGSMATVEAMLLHQAIALQGLSARLIERGMGCEHAPAFDVNMRHALRAQAQSRATLETLAMVRQGPAVFARTANVVNGAQQVNVGGGAPMSDGRARSCEGGAAVEGNGLLEANNGKRLGRRAQGSTGCSDPVLAPVGGVDRADDARGADAGGAERR